MSFRYFSARLLGIIRLGSASAAVGSTLCGSPSSPLRGQRLPGITRSNPNSISNRPFPLLTEARCPTLQDQDAWQTSHHKLGNGDFP
jgi:hypothetical protein